MPKTRVYIDGFNLYHGIIEHNRLHWLDLNKFAIRLNDGHSVERIIYCTARVSGTPLDPDKANRQDGYIRALGIACPNVEIIWGQFTTHSKRRYIDHCLSSPACSAKVTITSEKGSDVNLAARLLHDAHLNRFDKAIVVSGDSDLVEPIRLVVEDVGKTVAVRNPRNMRSQELEAVASHYARIKPAVLQASQLAETVTDGNSTYAKPKEWSAPKRKFTKTAVLSVPCPLAGCGNQISTCRHL